MADKKILLIDDEAGIRQYMQDHFEDCGYTVTIAGDGLEGVEKFGQGTFDLVLCDMMMPKLLGLEVLKRIKAAKPEQRIIMLTGVKEETMVAEAKALGCLHYLNKPFNLSDLEKRVAEALAA